MSETEPTYEPFVPVPMEAKKWIMPGLIIGGLCLLIVGRYTIYKKLSPPGPSLNVTTAVIPLILTTVVKTDSNYR